MREPTCRFQHHFRSVVGAVIDDAEQQRQWALDLLGKLRRDGAKDEAREVRSYLLWLGGFARPGDETGRACGVCSCCTNGRHAFCPWARRRPVTPARRREIG